jgi:hypothetical protein
VQRIQTIAVIVVEMCVTAYVHVTVYQSERVVVLVPFVALVVCHDGVVQQQGDGDDEDEVDMTAVFVVSVLYA